MRIILSHLRKGMDPKAHHANKIRRTWRVNRSCWSPCRPFQPACGSSPQSPPCSPPPPELPIWITLPNVDTTCLYSGQHILLLSIPPWTNNYLAIKFFIEPFQFFQKAHLLLNNPNLSQTCVQSLYSFIFITHCDNDADYYVTEYWCFLSKNLLKKFWYNQHSSPGTALPASGGQNVI